MRAIGIDPGQRHTGLCSLTPGAEPLFHQIDTGDLPMLESANKIRTELQEWMQATGGAGNVRMLTMERQLSVGAQSSSLMFYMQMNLLSIVAPIFATTGRLAMPLPSQLVSYMRKRHGIDTTSASTIVNCFKAKENWKPRISQHKVDAFYLAKLGLEVLEGNWEYKLPSNEAALFHGVILNGQGNR